MTSVAYKAGTLASDSACTGANTYHGAMTKLVRRADGAIAGAAGACANITEFFDWFIRDDGSKLTFSGAVDFEALIVLPGGKVLVVGDHGVPFPIRARHYGIGSGTKMVLAAMAAGADAPKAVRIACSLDTGSRGPVQVLRLKDGKPK